MVVGEVLGQLVPCELVVGCDPMHDARLLEDRKIPVGTAHRQPRFIAKDLLDRHRAAGAREGVVQSPAALGVALAGASEPDGDQIVSAVLRLPHVLHHREPTAARECAGASIEVTSGIILTIVHVAEMLALRFRVVAFSLVLSAAAAGCASAPASAGTTGGKLLVVAAENVWGSLAAQLGGDRVAVTSIITKPGADPHDYEPTAADARLFADAGLVIVNGIGYDPWTERLIDANPVAGRVVLDVGDVVGVPTGGNPHQWYSPDGVRRVVDAITGVYRTTSPAKAAYFEALRTRLLDVGLKGYFGVIERIRATYAGTPVGASESIFEPMAPALGLDLITPPGFLKAISEGTDPTSADTSTADAQIRYGRIRIYVYNSQNATPDVQRQVDGCRAETIPVTVITETLVPEGATFQAWQVRQLAGIAAALRTATGR